MSGNAKNLFDEFAPVSAAEWKAKIEADLKGKPYEGLLWETPEGITVKPDYTKEDIGNEAPTPSTTSNDWFIRQDVRIDDLAASNKQILIILNAGVNALGILQNSNLTADEITKLMAGVEPTYIRTEIACKADNVPAWLTYFADKDDYPEGSFDFDPLSEKGNLEDTDKELVKTVIEALPNFKAITIHAAEEENAVKELTLILAKGHQYLYELTNSGLPAELVLHTLQFAIPISTNYFMQIAKLRTLQQLWALIAAKYGVQGATPFIQSYNAPADQSQEEPYTNMLRHTTQAMSAAIGGSQVVNIWDNNQTDERSNAFFQRVARNVQHILKYESHLDKVADPGAGSYYLESLTNELAIKTWDAFKALEQEGGYPKLMNSYAS